MEKPNDFISKTRVLPIKNKENLRIDIIFGALPFEKDALAPEISPISPTRSGEPDWDSDKADSRSPHRDG